MATELYIKALKCLVLKNQAALMKIIPVFIDIQIFKMILKQKKLVIEKSLKKFKFLFEENKFVLPWVQKEDVNFIPPCFLHKPLRKK